jgi:antitoxin (DNA-binding transcriptional repressor) of toxin-antitoxin stability system
MTLTLTQAQADLTNLVHRLPAGEVVEIVEDGRTVAKLTIVIPTVPPGWRQPGLLKGAITILKDDDEHLKDFAEYMP